MELNKIIKTTLLIGLLILIGVVVLLGLKGAGPPPTPAPAADAERVSEINQIELALELHYSEHEEYPTTLKTLVEKNLLGSNDIKDDPHRTDREYFYNYAYGVDKKSNEIKYYHLGAVLDSGSGGFSSDKDYSSSENKTNINWHPDAELSAPCLGPNGFNGSDDNDCGLENREGVYDYGVFNQSSEQTESN